MPTPVVCVYYGGMTQTPRPVRAIPTTLAEILEEQPLDGLTMDPTVFAVVVTIPGTAGPHLRLFARHEAAAGHLADVVRLAIHDRAGYVPIPLQTPAHVVPAVRTVLEHATGWGIEAHLRELPVVLS